MHLVPLVMTDQDIIKRLDMIDDLCRAGLDFAERAEVVLKEVRLKMMSLREDLLEEAVIEEALLSHEKLFGSTREQDDEQFS